MKKLLLAFTIFSCSTLIYADEQQDMGQTIFEAYCTNACHQTPNATGLNNKQWQVVINTMQKRMKSAGMPPLTDTERQQLLDYLGKQKNQEQ